MVCERGTDRVPADDVILRKRIEQRLRDSLVFKADVHLVAADTFEKPGAAKGAFVLRKYPDLP